MTGDKQNNRGGKLKVLAIHRYYWPDIPPYASMLRKIVGWWRADGHHIDVLSSQPSYKSTLKNKLRPKRDLIDGVSVRRLKLPCESGRPFIRVLNALHLCFMIIFKALWFGKYDVIMVSTAPPVLGGVAAAIAAKLTGARLIYHCMDIHPEIGRISGEFSQPLVFNILRWLDSWTCRVAKPVVVLSDDMAAALRYRPSGKDIDIEVLNNFSLPDELSEVSEIPFQLKDETFKVLFAGNIGRFQGLETVIEAMKILRKRTDIEFLFMGEGVLKASLKEKVAENRLNVHFFDHQPVGVAKAVMRKVQVGFIGLKPELYRYAYPSKTMTYMEQGCPLLVTVELQSKLAQDVNNLKLGRAIPSGDAQLLAQTICEMADCPNQLTVYRESVLYYAKKYFSADAVSVNWQCLLEMGHK